MAPLARLVHLGTKRVLQSVKVGTSVSGFTARSCQQGAPCSSWLVAAWQHADAWQAGSHLGCLPRCPGGVRQLPCGTLSAAGQRHPSHPPLRLWRRPAEGTCQQGLSLRTHARTHARTAAAPGYSCPRTGGPAAPSCGRGLCSHSLGCPRRRRPAPGPRRKRPWWADRRGPLQTRDKVGTRCNMVGHSLCHGSKSVHTASLRQQH